MKRENCLTTFNIPAFQLDHNVADNYCKSSKKGLVSSASDVQSMLGQKYPHHKFGFLEKANKITPLRSVLINYTKKFFVR